MAESKSNSSDDSKLPKLRIGGVPEHFNLPWTIAIERNLFTNLGLQVEFIEIKQGTGAMIEQLKNGTVDIIIALTEGLIADICKGSTLKLLGTYVESPLVWAISTGINSKYTCIEDLKGSTIGISRYQSGSHLMSCVLASQRGWNQNDLNYSIQHNFDNLRASVNNNTCSAFMWEQFMQKPYYDKKEIRRIGEIVTPWPCFALSSTENVINNNINSIKLLFQGIQQACEIFKTDPNTINRLCELFHLQPNDATAWFDNVRITASNSISESTIETTIQALINAQVLPNNFHLDNYNNLFDNRICNLISDIKTMRLYNKPELLTAIFNNLNYRKLSKGPISYTQLLPFDQNHYYGTQALDECVDKLKLVSGDNIIQIGSNLGGCSRYLSGKYGIQCLAVELQSDLHNAAVELTERCTINNNNNNNNGSYNVSELVHHISGDYLKVSRHLNNNYYNAIVSWITILHFTQNERKQLFDNSFKLLKENGYFYCEDFIAVNEPNNNEKKVLQHDIYVRYLPTIEQYKSQLQQSGFYIVQINDLTESWKQYTQERLNKFEQNRSELIKLHGDELYERLRFFYSQVCKLFQGRNIGGARIIAQKRNNHNSNQEQNTTNLDSNKSTN